VPPDPLLAKGVPVKALIFPNPIILDFFETIVDKLLEFLNALLGSSLNL
jgi:hypothetical protein